MRSLVAFVALALVSKCELEVDAQAREALQEAKAAEAKSVQDDAVQEAIKAATDNAAEAGK